MKTFRFSLVLRTRENTDVFVTLDDNIYGIHGKRVNILYIPTNANVPEEAVRKKQRALSLFRYCRLYEYS